MKNWKTTLAGILTVGTVIVHQFLPQYATLWSNLIGVLAGLGLIAAQDAKKPKEPTNGG